MKKNRGGKQIKFALAKFLAKSDAVSKNLIKVNARKNNTHENLKSQESQDAQDEDEAKMIF